MGEKNKICATKPLFTNFTRAKVMEQGVNLYANRLVPETLMSFCLYVIDLVKVFDAILTSRQTREKLQ